jgi:hypothetical protein
MLKITLPYNMHHFDDVMVITSKADVETRLFAFEGLDCAIHITDAFYEDGAYFNKWRALEEGLDNFGRHGWLCLLDADILIPKKVPEFNIERGTLYTPLRRMYPSLTGVPQEPYWPQYPVHRNVAEFAGYCQVFHAEDPVLGPAPWHDINWKHAGGADSFFQQKWHHFNKVRPPFEVLHIGEPTTNWFGRATQYSDGSLPQQSEARLEKLRETFQIRRLNRNYNHEKIQQR